MLETGTILGGRYEILKKIGTGGMADVLEFHRTFWNGKYYVSPGYQGKPDDRAQALAVVSGVLPKELYPN